MVDDPFDGLDPVIHQPARLRIMTRLVVLGRVRFARLREITNLSAGNLATHLEALERATYVRTKDALFGRSLGTSVEITKEGEAALRLYVQRLEGALRSVRANLPEPGFPLRENQAAPDS